MPNNVFISYSHNDDKVLERLHKHLAMLRREGSISAWTDHKILPGAKFDQEIVSALEKSNIFLALISPDYLDSNYCYEREFQHAMRLTDAGAIKIVPVIIEPCDWLSSPFKDFNALPKNGQAVATWANQNNAFLDIVTGLRRIIEQSPEIEAGPARGTIVSSIATNRNLKVKRDFDAIQKTEFADRSYSAIREYFRLSCNELSNISNELKGKFEDVNNTTFTCLVVNRGRRSGGDSGITIRNSKRRSHGGELSFSHQWHADSNTSNGFINVEADDYALHLILNDFSSSNGRNEKFSPEQVAEMLWNSFVKRAGIEYE